MTINDSYKTNILSRKHFGEKMCRINNNKYPIKTISSLKLFKAFRNILFLLIVSILGWGCSTVPITGRKQVSFIPDSEMLAMSFNQYAQFIRNNKVIEGTKDARMVKRIGQKISKSVEGYFAQKNMAEHLKGYDWEFNLIDNKQVNAWCMPGGKVVVYTGILPYTKTEEGLAVVIGHEIAHAVAEHGSERMSQQMLVQMGGMALSKAIEEKPVETRNLFMTAYGLGAQFGALLPYSRLHESEADRLGLIFMAMAGYHPKHAITFWQRMAENSQGEDIPEFMRTHPSDQKRINNLKKLQPEAMKYYKN